MTMGQVAVGGESPSTGFGPNLETPFALDSATRTEASAPSAPSGAELFELRTPFVSEYGVERTTTLAGPRAELFADLMGEFHDEDFEGAVADLVHEAAALAQEQFSYEAADAAGERQESMRGLRESFEPLERESIAALEGLTAHVSGTDPSSLSEAEFEALLDGYQPEPAGLSPAFEDFLSKLVKKAKGVVGKVAKVAKKGIELAKKLSPVHLVLGKLKGLVRPLLERVLRFAVDKLPVAVRPIARQLAKKFLRVGELEAFDEAETFELAAADPATISRELDARISGFVLDGEDAERFGEQFVDEAADVSEAEAWRRLQRARKRFARELGELETGAEVQPVVDQFVPVVLAGLKLGVSLLGRPRVVGFLAGLLSKLIGKYVGKAQAEPLSKALVDAGLRVAGLEAAPEGVSPAGEALAATVEDTVNRLVRDAPEVAWQSEALLEGYAREAFARAASAHFPDDLIRSELHEAADTSGAWELWPRATTTKLFKKYSRVLEVSIGPQQASSLKSFGGVPLADILRDQHGVSPTKPLRARMHLYEAITGTTIAAIAACEKRVRGLGSPARGARSQLHPLTPEAAAILLKEPTLGKAVDARFLADPNVLEVGQRLFFLEFSEGTGRMVSPRVRRAPPRVAATKILLDLPGGVLRIRHYLSEAEAQALSSMLRKRAPAGALLGALRGAFESRVAAMFSGAPTRSLRVVHEAVPTESLLPSAIGLALRAVGRPLSTAVTKWLLDALSRELKERYDNLAAEFTRAADATADGLTLVLTFSRPPFFAALRALLGGDLSAARGLKSALSRTPDYSLVIRPGYARK